MKINITLLFLPISIMAMQENINYNAQLLKAAESGDVELIKFALSNGANIEARAQNQNTPLHLAAFNGHVPALIELVKFHANIKAKNQIHDTPLHLAADNGHVQAINELVKLGANIEAQGQGQATPLHCAAFSGRVPAIIELVKLGANIEAKKHYQITPLHLAAYNGHVPALIELVKFGANREAKTHNQVTPLHVAAEKGHVTAIIELVKLGANIEAKNHKQNTPLNLATIKGHTLAIIELVRLGANINIIGYKQSTPLNDAVWENKIDAAEILLKLGANTEVIHNFDEHFGPSTSLQNAITQNKPELIKLLLKYGARKVCAHSDPKILVNILNNNSINSAKLLFEYNIVFSKEILQQLIKLLINNNLNTDIIRAVIFDKLNLINSILSLNRANSVQLNAKDSTGTTPIMWAAARGNTEIIKALFDYRKENKIIIDLVQANMFDESAIDLAYKHNHLGDLKRLQKAVYNQAKNTISNALSKLILQSTIDSNERIKIEKKPYNPSLFAIIIAQYLSGETGKICAYCQAPEPEKKCVCKIKYCSAFCQRTDWNNHKELHYQKMEENKDEDDNEQNDE